MKINNSIKRYSYGMGKVIPPALTCKIILRKLKKMSPSILAQFYELKKETKIPQYRVEGSLRYRNTVQRLLSSWLGSNGKGHCKKQALASGLMELVERYSCVKHILDNKAVQFFSFKELRDNPFAIEDVFANVISDSDKKVLREVKIESAKIQWYEGYTLSGERVLLPIKLLVYYLGGSNGMAAGNSLEEALVHGVCEVIEAHCISLIELEKIVTPLIDPNTIKNPIAKSLIRKFESLQGQSLYIKDFSLDLGIPTVGVVRKTDAHNCTITCGVATGRDEALIRALTENSQTEGPESSKKIHSAWHYFLNKKVVSMEDLSDIEDTNIKVELQRINRLLKQRDMKAFFVDATDRELKVPVVIVYIAGTKFIYSQNTVNKRSLLAHLINTYMETENYRDGERYLKMNQRETVYEMGCLYIKGLLAKRHARYKEAIRYFLRAVQGMGELRKEDFKILKSMKKIFINMGLCYQTIHDIDSALNCYLKSIDKFPRDNIEELAPAYGHISLPSRQKEIFNRGVELFRAARGLRARYPKKKIYRH